MPRKQASKKTPRGTTEEQIPEEISETEQWRLIQESGVLNSIQKPSPSQEPDTFDRIFDTVLFVIPFSFLYLMMDIIVHQQYRQNPTVGDYAGRLIPAIPVISIIIYYINIRKSQRLVQVGAFVASIALGMRLIWIVNRSSWLIITRQGPPVATLWIYSIVILDLLPAVLSLVIICGWLWWAGMQLIF
ncbi:hypothetical protein M422DRAFT_22889 [Sphaerobolus stellatus SS14]|nr:hypothetical protein M422DRAFT_22889 [Sphaerobolus stellatus SS14]